MELEATYIINLLKKVGHRLSLFHRIFHILDNKTRIALYNWLDYADTVWGDQSSLKSEKLQSFQQLKETFRNILEVLNRD